LTNDKQINIACLCSRKPLKLEIFLIVITFWCFWAIFGTSSGNIYVLAFFKAQHCLGKLEGNYMVATLDDKQALSILDNI
jgi:hypothetical protein